MLLENEKGGGKAGATVFKILKNFNLATRRLFFFYVYIKPGEKQVYNNFIH